MYGFRKKNGTSCVLAANVPIYLKYNTLILKPLPKYDIEIPPNAWLLSGKRVPFNKMLETDLPLQIYADRIRHSNNIDCVFVFHDDDMSLILSNQSRYVFIMQIMYE